MHHYPISSSSEQPFPLLTRLTPLSLPFKEGRTTDLNPQAGHHLNIGIRQHHIIAPHDHFFTLPRASHAPHCNLTNCHAYKKQAQKKVTTAMHHINAYNKIKKQPRAMTCAVIQFLYQSEPFHFSRDQHQHPHPLKRTQAFRIKNSMMHSASRY